MILTYTMAHRKIYMWSCVTTLYRRKNARTLQFQLLEDVFSYLLHSRIVWCLGPKPDQNYFIPLTATYIRFFEKKIVRQCIYSSLLLFSIFVFVIQLLSNNSTTLEDKGYLFFFVLLCMPVTRGQKSKEAYARHLYCRLCAKSFWRSLI